jgi:hypothetical protein
VEEVPMTEKIDDITRMNTENNKHIVDIMEAGSRQRRANMREKNVRFVVPDSDSDSVSLNNQDSFSVHLDISSGKNRIECLTEANIDVDEYMLGDFKGKTRSIKHQNLSLEYQKSLSSIQRYLRTLNYSMMPVNKL